MYKKSSNFLKKDHKSSKNVQTKLKFPKISSKLKKSSKKFKIQQKFKFTFDIPRQCDFPSFMGQ